jgi:uncharacterized protein (TIGR02271 family)
MPNDEERLVIPLVEETVRVERHPVDGARVRIDAHVKERNAVIDEVLQSEDVVVERVPIGTIIDTAPTPRQEGDTLIIPLVEEEVFVKRRLVLREELRVRKRSTSKHHQSTIPLRSLEATVTRVDSTHNVERAHDINDKP